MRGCFFLAGSSATHAGPERVADLLNAETGFFPFELNAGAAPHTVLYNRAQVVLVTLLERDTTRRSSIRATTSPPSATVRMLLSNGQRVEGRGARLPSERARSAQRLGARARDVPLRRNRRRTLIVNVAHIVEVSEMTES